MRSLALVGLLLVALQGAAVPVHAFLTATHASAVDLALASADAPALTAAAGHDAAECPLCRELARSRAAALAAPPLAARVAHVLQPHLLGDAIAAPPRLAAGAAGPRAPPLLVVSPTA